MQTITPPASTRLISLDAMRGFVMASMILVNYPGSWDYVFEPLEHAAWNGLTPTDLIFPSFVFMVGVSICLSYRKRVASGEHGGKLYRKILLRAAEMYLIGMFLSLLPTFDFSKIGFAGVLQRISIVFLCCSLLYLNTTVRTQIATGVVILVGYWLCMTLIPTPGLDYAALEPGVNLAAWVDSKLLPGRMWNGTWDPEGILSTFPAIVTGITGMIAGHLLTSKRTQEEKVILLMVGGLAAVAAGYIWGLTFPVNKNLWTSSYVLVSSGIAALVLGTMYYLVDIRHYQSWTKPGIVFGSNAIAIYFISDFISYLFYWLPFGSAPISDAFVSSLISTGVYPKLASLLFAIIFVAINFFIALFLYRRKIFVKL